MTWSCSDVGNVSRNKFPPILIPRPLPSFPSLAVPYCKQREAGNEANSHPGVVASFPGSSGESLGTRQVVEYCFLDSVCVCLDLKRFYGLRFRRKLSAKVRIPLSLNIAGFLTREMGEFIVLTSSLCGNHTHIHTTFSPSPSPPHSPHSFPLLTHPSLPHTRIHTTHTHPMHTLIPLPPHTHIQTHHTHIHTHTQTENELKGLTHYELYAIANHMGSESWGHYTATYKHHTTHKWYNVSDDKWVDVSFIRAL